MIIRETSDWEGCFRFLRRMDIPKSGLEIKWGPPKRSNKQNRYLWGTVYKTLADGLSELHKAHITPEDMHKVCKDSFMPRYEIPGLKKMVPMSTTELCRSGNEVSFQDYVTQIQQLAAERGIYILDPNESPREQI